MKHISYRSASSAAFSAVSALVDRRLGLVQFIFCEGEFLVRGLQVVLQLRGKGGVNTESDVLTVTLLTPFLDIIYSH